MFNKKFLTGLLLAASISVTSSCALVNATQCVAGGCAERIANRQQVLNTEQQAVADAKARLRDTEQRQRDTAYERQQLEASYDALQRELTSMEASLKKARHRDYALEQELAALKKDIARQQAAPAIRNNSGSSSVIAKEQQALQKLKKRKKALESQVQILLGK